MKIVIGITAADFAGNKGAAAMLQSILVNTQKEHPDADYKLFSVYPSEDRQQNTYSNLEIVSCKPEQIIFIAFPLAVLFFLLKWIRPVRSLLLKNKILKGIYACDFIVDAAGISFVDSRGFVMNTYNFICAATPTLLGRKVIKVSQALGPFNRFWNRLWAKMVLPKLDRVCARGSITESYLTGLGLENIELCADIAFSMQDSPDADRSVESIKAKSPAFWEHDVVSVSISSVVNKYCIKNDIDYAGIMKQFILHLNQKGYGVLIIANAARKGSLKSKNNDLVICQKVYDSLDNKDACIWYPEEFTPEIIRSLISQTKILIASRFHAMIGALEKGVPVLLIGWSHKYKEVLDMFDIGSYALDYKQLKFKDLVDEFARLESEYNQVRQKIEINLPAVKKSSYRNIEIIAEKAKAVSGVKNGN